MWEAGFSLDSTDELGWPDMNVPNKRNTQLVLQWEESNEAESSCGKLVQFEAAAC